MTGLIISFWAGEKTAEILLLSVIVGMQVGGKKIWKHTWKIFQCPPKCRFLVTNRTESDTAGMRISFIFYVRLTLGKSNFNWWVYTQSKAVLLFFLKVSKFAPSTRCSWSVDGGEGKLRHRAEMWFLMKSQGTSGQVFELTSHPHYHLTKNII